MKRKALFACVAVMPVAGAAALRRQHNGSYLGDEALTLYTAAQQ